MFFSKLRFTRWAAAFAAIAIAGAVPALLLTVGPLAGATQGSGTPLPSGVISDASWAHSYNGIPAMTQASYAVVSGSAMAASQYHDHGVLFTKFTFAVDRVLKGPLTPGENIPVLQTGGSTPSGQVDIIEDDPLLVKGTEYLMFLKFDESTGVYFESGGPDGRFVVDNGKIKPLSAVYPNDHIGDTGISGLTLNQVAHQMTLPVPPSPTPPPLAPGDNIGRPQPGTGHPQ